MCNEKYRLSLCYQIKRDFESLCNSEEFAAVYLYLVSLKELDKVIPYRLFDGEDITYYGYGGCIFEKWLHEITVDIEKDFNKGRKVVRYVKDMIKKYGLCLPYTLGNDYIFGITLRVFLLDLEKGTNEKLNISHDMYIKLRMLKRYLTSIIALLLLEHKGLMDVLINEIILTYNASKDINLIIDEILRGCIDYVECFEDYATCE